MEYGKKITLSIVVPVYSGDQYLDELTNRLGDVRRNWIESDSPVSLAEVIYVDDGSTGRCASVLSELADSHPWVSVLKLSRNFGQHAASIAGILHSSGDWIVTMDEDLQHPPEKIPAMLKKAVESDLDVVYARPLGQVHENNLRDMSSKFYKRLIEKLTNNPHIRNANSFRLIRGSVARGASSVCGHDTYFDVALIWFSERIGMVSMDLKDSRFINDRFSGYNLKSLISHGRKLLVSSDLKVLRFGAIFGLLMVLLSALGGLTLLVTKIMNPDVISTQGWTSLILAVTLFGGLSLMFLGIGLEYLALLVQKAHGRPLFFAIDRSSDKYISTYFDKFPL